MFLKKINQVQLFLIGTIVIFLNFDDFYLVKVFEWKEEFAYLHDFSELPDFSCNQVSLPFFNVSVIQIDWLKMEPCYIICSVVIRITCY